MRGGHGSLEQALEIVRRAELRRCLRAEVLEEDRGEAARRGVHPPRISELRWASTIARDLEERRRARQNRCSLLRGLRGSHDGGHALPE